jgi:hypothetical protein
MLKTKYHPALRGVILATDLFNNKEVPLIDLRNLNLHAHGTYLLPVSQNVSSVTHGYFGYNPRKKEYFFKTKEGRVLSFEDSNILTRALGENRLKLENSYEIIMEKECLSKILVYQNEAVPGANPSDLHSLEVEAQRSYKGIIKLL